MLSGLNVTSSTYLLLLLFGTKFYPLIWWLGARKPQVPLGLSHRTTPPVDLSPASSLLTAKSNLGGEFHSTMQKGVKKEF